jgi:antitoxin component of MazEF toxin-antitoxin module
MGYPVKIQKVQRPTNRSYYINLPAAVADALRVQKAEVFEWEIEDKNTLVLSRAQRKPPRSIKKKHKS